MTKATLRTRVLTDFGFDVSSAKVDEIVFERYAAMVVEAKYLEAAIEIDTTTAGTGAYDIDTSYADVHRVTIDDAEYERTGSRTLAGLKSGRLRLTLSRGISGVFAPAFTSTGGAQIELWPAPTSTGDSIVGALAIEPPAFSGDGDTPKIPSHLHRYIAYGAIAELLALDDERPQDADRYEAMFQAGIDKLRSYKTSRVGSGPIQAKVAGYHF